MSENSISTAPTCAPHSSCSSSAVMRSAETCASRARLRCSAAAVSGSTENPRCAANRSARRMRSASSCKRVSGSPTQRMHWRRKSACPPNGSHRPRTGLHAIALMVKSRRARSHSMSSTNDTLSGRLPSEYAPSVRKVVTSTGSPSSRTVTVPCFSPVSMTVRSANSCSTCSGRAAVHTS